MNCVVVVCHRLQDRKSLAENIDSSFKSLSTYIEPLMVTLVGGIVAIILIAMYLPMFRIGMVIS